MTLPFLNRGRSESVNTRRPLQPVGPANPEVSGDAADLNAKG